MEFSTTARLAIDNASDAEDFVQTRLPGVRLATTAALLRRNPLHDEVGFVTVVQEYKIGCHDDSMFRTNQTNDMILTIVLRAGYFVNPPAFWSGRTMIIVMCLAASFTTIINSLHSLDRSRSHFPHPTGCLANVPYGAKSLVEAEIGTVFLHHFGS